MSSVKRALIRASLLVLGLLAFNARANILQLQVSAAGSNEIVKYELQANVVSCGLDPAGGGGGASNSESGRLCTSPESKLFGNIVIVEGTPHPGTTGVRGRLYDVGTLCNVKLTEKIDRAWIAFMDCGGCPLATKMANLARTNPQAVLLYNQSNCIFSNKSPSENTPSSTVSSTAPASATSSSTPAPPPASTSASTSASAPTSTLASTSALAPTSTPAPASTPASTPAPAPSAPSQATPTPSPPPKPEPAGGDDQKKPPAPPAADPENPKDNPSSDEPKDPPKGDDDGSNEKDDPDDDDEEEDDDSADKRRRRSLYARADSPQKKTGVSLNGDGASTAGNGHSAGTAAAIPTNVFFDSVITLAMADQVVIDYLFKVLLGPASSSPLPEALSAIKNRSAQAIGGQDLASTSVTDLMISISPVMVAPNPGETQLLSMSKPIFVGVAIIISLLVGYVLLAHVVRPLYRRYRENRDDSDGMQPLGDDGEHHPHRGDLEGGHRDPGDQHEQQEQQQRNIRASDWKALSMFPTSDFGSLRRSKGSGSFAPDRDPEKEMMEVQDSAPGNEQTDLADDRDEVHSGLPAWKNQPQQHQNSVTDSNVGGMMVANYEGGEGGEVGHETGYDGFQHYDGYNAHGTSEYRSNLLDYNYHDSTTHQDLYLDRLYNTTGYDQHPDELGNAAVQSWQRGVQSDLQDDYSVKVLDRSATSRSNNDLPQMIEVDHNPEGQRVHRRHGSELFGWVDHPRRSLDILQRVGGANHRVSTDSTAFSQAASGDGGGAGGAHRLSRSNSSGGSGGLASTIRRGLMSSAQASPINGVDIERDPEDHFTTKAARPSKIHTTYGTGPMSASAAASSSSPYHFSFPEDRSPMVRASLDVPRQQPQRATQHWSPVDAAATTPTTNNHSSINSASGRHPRASFAGDFPRRTSLDGLHSASTTGPASSTYRRSLDQGRPSAGLAGSPSSNLSGLQDVNGVAEGVTTRIDLAELMKQEEEIAFVLHPPPPTSPQPNVDKTATPTSARVMSARPSEGPGSENIVYAPIPITPTSATRLTHAEELNDRTRQKRPFRAHAVKPDRILTTSAAIATSFTNPRAQRDERAAAAAHNATTVHGNVKNHGDEGHDVKSENDDDDDDDEDDDEDSDARVSPQCPICLEQYSKNTMVRSLPCHHYFHQPCIDAWLLSNDRGEWACPVCKQDLMVLSGQPHMSRSWRANHPEEVHHQFHVSPDLLQQQQQQQQQQPSHPPEYGQPLETSSALSPIGALSPFGSLWVDPDRLHSHPAGAATTRSSAAAPVGGAANASPKTTRGTFLRRSSRAPLNEQEATTPVSGSQTPLSAKTPHTPSRLRSIFNRLGSPQQH
ncbi:E3 ubiquitin-protein ligase Zswim2 [Actinomortierella ambigua]|uniref:RING-type E3 ubiquitin transferase n=1 Tax=Actinomortierella ambigua TaxID=1343610 RepID=A0A9P6U3V5_9FUNG|nr:E3 ubiquitin-protein ligase Zswim2 [Actinomortierella ambigua]